MVRAVILSFVNMEELSAEGGKNKMLKLISQMWKISNEQKFLTKIVLNFLWTF